MSSPKVSAAMNDAMSALGRDPALTAAGAKLFDRISQDPQVAQAGQAIIGKLTTSTEIQQVVMKIMVEHPDATPDEVGQLVGAQFSGSPNHPRSGLRSRPRSAR